MTARDINDKSNIKNTILFLYSAFIRIQNSKIRAAIMTPLEDIKYVLRISKAPIIIHKSFILIDLAFALKTVKHIDAANSTIVPK